ncbi:adenylate kinase [Rhodophyticola sp. CCM32]|uniref:adenylate kinase n=1 Tax=Rhodophyticola sp. CCM32 TaxID=2916397 RepID=UPI00107F578F|nr:adenylate kinase [Rhodophyticola sp. CCM32]QBX99914.1 adenylate kinase [Rhodophyticola sp. CCM32]
MSSSHTSSHTPRQSFVFVILGPPGSGKGTQARRMADTFGLTQLSTGDLLRKAVANGTPAGLAARAEMEAGALVSDDIVIAVLKDALARPDGKDGVLLDGFPRTITQAKALDALLTGDGNAIAATINLVVDDDAMVARISGRHSCARCGEGYHITFKRPAVEGVCDICGSTGFKRRADDTAETVRVRLVEYHAQTAPLIEYYDMSDVLFSIPAMGEIADISDRIKAVIAAKMQV